MTTGGRGVGFDVACSGTPGGSRTPCAVNSTRIFLSTPTPIFSSGATPERARFEGVIPFQARVRLSWERLPGRTLTWRDAADWPYTQTSPIYLWSDSGAGQASGSDSLPSNGAYTSGGIPEQETSVCDGSDSLRKGAVPKTEHNEGADPKIELIKLNTALRLVCWSVSFRFCRVSFLVGRFASRSCLCFSAFEGFRDAFFQRNGDDPRTDHFWQVLPYQARLWYVIAAWLRSVGYAIFCEAVPCAIGYSGRQISLSSTSSVGAGFYFLLFLKSMKATVFMYVARLCCREISGFSPHRTS